MRHVLTVGAGPRSAGTIRLEDLAAGTDPVSARNHVAAVQSGIDPDDVAVFQLSGGTTGVPKVIPRRHAEYWYNAAAYAQRLGWDEHSRVAHLIPIIHNAGIVCGVHAPHSVGACLVLGTPDAAASMPLLIEEQITDVLIGHAHYRAIADGITALSGSVRRVVLSGAKVPPDLFERDRDPRHLGRPAVRHGRGLLRDDPARLAARARMTTVGTPLSALDEFRILDPARRPNCPTAPPVNCAAAARTPCPGYFDAAEHNAVAFTAEGFFRTGDLASVRIVNDIRYLSIDGRIKDVINRGGEKINAEEVELLLISHPAVLQVAVVAMPDPRLGERTCAFLVARDEPVTLADPRPSRCTRGGEIQVARTSGVGHRTTRSANRQDRQWTAEEIATLAPVRYGEVAQRGETTSPAAERADGSDQRPVYCPLHSSRSAACR